MLQNEETRNLRQRQKMRKTAAWILGIGGFMSVYLAASTEDYRSDIEDTNKFYGAEVYPTEDIASPKTTKAMTWAGALAMLTAAGLAYKNQKERQ